MKRQVEQTTRPNGLHMARVNSYEFNMGHNGLKSPFTSLQGEETWLGYLGDNISWR
jgi:hypothetical protein